MLKKIAVAALLAGIAGLSGQASAQEVRDTMKIYARDDGSATLVRERVVDGPTQTIERTVIIGPAYRIPVRNTGVSRINGGVGGAIGGYYINGTTPATNRSLYVPSWVDAYQH